MRVQNRMPPCYIRIKLHCMERLEYDSYSRRQKRVFGSDKVADGLSTDTTVKESDLTQKTARNAGKSAEKGVGKYRKEIDELNLFDNQYMQTFFEEDAAAGFQCISLILQTLLNEPTLRVVKMEHQRGVYGFRREHDVIFDILAVDARGRYYDIEIQRAGSVRDIARRARYYAAELDRVSFRKGRRYRELRDNYVIFIMEGDLYRRGRPYYEALRTIPQLEHELFDDGSHIIVVNGSYIAEDSVGWLMHDFRCKKVEDMHHELLQNLAGDIKGTHGGKKKMSGVFERVERRGRRLGLKKGRAQERLTMIRTVIRSFGLTKEQALEKLQIPMSEREQLLSQL